MDHNAITEKLLAAGLRPTRQRILLGHLLFSGPCRHVTAETLHREAKAANVEVSLATIYNTLHHLMAVKLVCEIFGKDGRSYFDTNMEPHHHFICEETGTLVDIPHHLIRLEHIPEPPEGMTVGNVEVVIRTRPQRVAA